MATLTVPHAFANEEIHRLETSSGTDITGNALFGYTGSVWAFGRSVSEPGFRLKALGGFGTYDYDGTIPLAGGLVPARFDGQVFLGELLLGRLWRHEHWTVKLYGGAEYARHSISPYDAGNSVRGGKWGGKALIEAWRNVGSNGFISLDGSYGSAFGEYWVQARMGRRLRNRLSAGIEGGVLGNEGYDTGRAGSFIRFHFGATDLTISGGVTGDYLEGDPSGYVTLGMYRKM